jgi:hypothetical protein
MRFATLAQKIASRAVLREGHRPDLYQRSNRRLTGLPQYVGGGHDSHTA